MPLVGAQSSDVGDEAVGEVEDSGSHFSTNVRFGIAWSLAFNLQAHSLPARGSSLVDIVGNVSSNGKHLAAEPVPS